MQKTVKILAVALVVVAVVGIGSGIASQAIDDPVITGGSSTSNCVTYCMNNGGSLGECIDECSAD